MLRQMSFGYKPLTTLKRTLIRALTRMNTPMRLQVPALREPLPAILALVRLLTRMAPHMDLQCTRPHERLITGRALERAFAGMATLVVSQVTKCCKTLLTHITFIRFFPRMDALVGLQVSLLGKLLPAIFKIADERFDSGMSLHVQPKAALTGVGLTT
jgi:hypothetical protein